MTDQQAVQGPNLQNIIDREIRAAIGDLVVQNVLLRAQLEIEQRQLAEVTAKPDGKVVKLNKGGEG
jgi:hypothetical protein